MTMNQEPTSMICLIVQVMAKEAVIQARLGSPAFKPIAPRIKLEVVR